MRKSEMNSLVAGVKIQSKKDLAVYTIVGIDLEQGKVILDNGKLYTMGTIQRWYSLYEEEIPEVVEPDNTILDDIEQADELTSEQDTTADTDTTEVQVKFNLGDKVVTNFGVGEVVSVPHLVELDGKVTMSNYRVAIVEDGQRYLFYYKEEQLEAYTEEQQNTDTTANTNDLKDTDTQDDQLYEDADTAVKKDIVEGNTATTNTAKTNTVQPTIQQDNLIQSLNNLVDLHGCYLEAKKEYIAVKKDGYKGTVCMIRNCRYGNGIHIDMKSKIWIALDEEYRQVVSEDHYTGIYDKTRKLFRIGYVRDLDILQVVILTALQLAS